MRRIWKKIRGRWQSYWQDDGDDPRMIHLSRQDKRSLLYGGFMVSIVTLFLLLAVVTVSNYRADRENAESLEKVLDMVNAYLATATKDEYEDVAETIRHDLVYSQYGEDIESLISNTFQIRRTDAVWTGRNFCHGSTLSFSIQGKHTVWIFWRRRTRRERKAVAYG